MQRPLSGIRSLSAACGLHFAEGAIAREAWGGRFDQCTQRGRRPAASDLLALVVEFAQADRVGYGIALDRSPAPLQRRPDGHGTRLLRAECAPGVARQHPARAIGRRRESTARPSSGVWFSRSDAGGDRAQRLRKSRVALLARAARTILCSVLILGPLARAGSAAQAPTEDQVKAVFVFNFSHFVEWPPQAFAVPTEPFVIGVLGSDAFGDRLDEAVRGEKLDQH